MNVTVSLYTLSYCLKHTTAINYGHVLQTSRLQPFVPQTVADVTLGVTPNEMLVGEKGTDWAHMSTLWYVLLAFFISQMTRESYGTSYHECNTGYAGSTPFQMPSIN